MPETYSVRGFGAMIADRARMDALERALERAMRPGSVVLDIGTGTGIFALMACRLGARQVYAVEPGDAIHLARQVARENGMADRIRFIQGVSTEIELPERADVVVSDLRGVLPLFQHHVPSIVDARERLMVPGGVLIPRSDTLRAAPVEAEEAHRKVVAPWDEHARGFRMDAPRRAAVNTWAKAEIDPARLVAEPRTWAVLDYRTIRDPDVRGTLAWTAARDAAAHGIAVWFDAEVAEGIGYTTGPEAPGSIYGTALFPWPHPVPLAAGDAVTVELQARLTGDDYVWVWETRVERGDGSRMELRQTTFLAQPLSAEALRRRAHDFRPVLGEDGRIDQAVLGMMDGGATLGDIARELQRRFPERFASWEEALSRAGRLSQACAR
ncbi:MAG TPA: 50S ribosomal protein L11 methyltransferase [Longimicrobium sp.]|nr:50S ribosomal protein L11 methyltransferase [Longimicrobium sp.]